MPDVFSYTDYRALLRNLCEETKREKPFFSYRYIGNKVGFRSAGFFTNVLNGKRNISSDLTFRFAQLFGFTKRETEYFEALVLYNQAKQHSRKRFYYEKMLSMASAKVRSLAADQYEYFEKWHYVAIRELLNYYDFDGDYQALGKMLRPAIRPSEAKRAVDLLERLDLVRKDDSGRYHVTDKTITNVPHVPPVAVHNFQLSTMDLAKESIDRFERDARSVSTLTLSMSKETFDMIQERLTAFRKELLDLVKNDPHEVDRVYQLNFQVYPLTRELPQDRT